MLKSTLQGTIGTPSNSPSNSGPMNEPGSLGGAAKPSDSPIPFIVRDGKAPTTPSSVVDSKIPTSPGGGSGSNNSPSPNAPGGLKTTLNGIIGK